MLSFGEPHRLTDFFPIIQFGRHSLENGVGIHGPLPVVVSPRLFFHVAAFEERKALRGLSSCRRPTKY